MRLSGLLLLCWLTAHSALACDTELGNDSIPALSLKQAQGSLNRTLLSLAKSEPTPTPQFDNIDCYLETQADFFPPLETTRGAVQQLGQQAASAESVDERRMAIDAINRAVARDAGTGFVMLPTTGGGITQINLYGDLIEAHCSTEPSQPCARATDIAQSLWQIVGIIRARADDLNKADKTASLAFNQKLDQQWRSYKDDTIKLWPQEVLLNSLFFQPRKSGLSAPPNYKLLTLRPSLGLSYLSDQSHRVQPTLNVDLLGVYWWRYAGIRNAQAQPGRGLSLSLVWDGDDTAYGLTYHHNPKWSATLARGDDNDVVLSVSFQLAHWLIRR